MAHITYTGADNRVYGIQLDCTEQAEVRHVGRVTTYPVYLGEERAHNVYVENTKLTLVGLISETPLEAPFIPNAIVIGAVLPASGPRQRVAYTVRKPVVGGAFRTERVSLDPSEPAFAAGYREEIRESFLSLGDSNAGQQNRAQVIYRELVRIFNARTVVTVSNKLDVFPNCKISGISSTTAPINAQPITIEFEQVKSASVLQADNILARSRSTTTKRAEQPRGYGSQTGYDLGFEQQNTLVFDSLL